MQELLIRLGEVMDKPAQLCIIGSTVCMSFGQNNRMTMDVDVWRKNSSFDLGSLKKACEKIGIDFDPRGYDEPAGVYIQLIDPGVVQLGTFDESLSIFKTGNLEIKCPPIENLIASKMVRGEDRDYNDCMFLIKKFNVSFDALEKVARTIPDIEQCKSSLENIGLLRCYVQFESSKEDKKKVKMKCSGCSM